MSNKAKVTVNKNDPFIYVERTFDAPKELVFKAFTTPELIEQWWGPRIYSTKVDKYEAKKGGAWRFINKDDKGNEFAFNGVIHEVTPDRIIQTFEFEPMPGHVCLETATFEEKDGKTTMKNISAFQSVADRDGMVQSGMEEGMQDTYNRLDELLVKLSS